uniref:Uncharacterized protein n=1 Tax=Sus scrofa TaxID=9823 RepID=A0A8W4FA30_PIG
GAEPSEGRLLAMIFGYLDVRDKGRAAQVSCAALTCAPATTSVTRASCIWPWAACASRGWTSPFVTRWGTRVWLT